MFRSWRVGPDPRPPTLPGPQRHDDGIVRDVVSLLGDTRCVTDLGALACPTQMFVLWPDGEVTTAWVLPAGTPVRVEPGVGDGVVRVCTLHEPRIFADVPGGWIERAEKPEETSF